MRRVVDINPDAVLVADTILYPMIRPEGRKLHPTDPRDAHLRRRWIDEYVRAGGTVVEVEESEPANQVCERCATPWLEIRYLHSDGSPVRGAEYVIEADEFGRRGFLDSNGRARIDNIPSLTNFSFYFENDPEVYIPRPPEVYPAEPEFRPIVIAHTQSSFDDAMDWLWGTVQGDFNRNPSFSQTAINMLIGLIPIADTALDFRDIIAGILHLAQFYNLSPEDQRSSEPYLDLGGDFRVGCEEGLWLDLFMIAVGFIPEAGTAIKGVFRWIIEGLRRHGRHGAQSLTQIWRLVMDFLNFAARQHGNAHVYLRALRDNLSGIVDDAVGHIRNAMRSFKEFMDTITLALRNFTGEPWVRDTLRFWESVREMFNEAASGPKNLYRQLARWKVLIRTRLGDWLEDVIGARRPPRQSGVPNTPTTRGPDDGPNELRQSARAPPPPQSPAQPPRVSNRVLGKWDDWQPDTPPRPATSPSAAQQATAEARGVDPRWVDGNGNLIYPERSRGFDEAPNVVRMEAGERFDRYGGYYSEGEFVDGGDYGAPLGSSFEGRSMPSGDASRDRYSYELNRPVEGVLEGKAAPWFGQPGGGVQQQFPRSIEDMLLDGTIRRVE